MDVEREKQKFLIGARALMNGSLAEDKAKRRALGAVMVHVVVGAAVETCSRRIERALPGLQDGADRASLQGALDTFAELAPWTDGLLSAALTQAGARDEETAKGLRQQAVDLIFQYANEREVCAGSHDVVVGPPGFLPPLGPVTRQPVVRFWRWLPVSALRHVLGRIAARLSRTRGKE